MKDKPKKPGAESALSQHRPPPTPSPSPPEPTPTPTPTPGG